GGELLKLAGILVETQLLPTGQLSAVMTGIGVNLSHAPAGLPAQAPQSDTTSLTERPYAAACLGQWMPEEEIPPTLVLAEQLASRVSLWYEGIN
ncbi:MAG: hypothetical protein VKK59_05380, partial [Vampirovibrionales bacterium]|nr:hypothetical protein [Vampirovibrionales bacterium]